MSKKLEKELKPFETWTVSVLLFRFVLKRADMPTLSQKVGLWFRPSGRKETVTELTLSELAVTQ